MLRIFNYSSTKTQKQKQNSNLRLSFAPIITILFTESDFHVEAFAVHPEELKMIPVDAVDVWFLWSIVE
jgi:hypothetical protein